MGLFCVSFEFCLFLLLFLGYCLCLKVGHLLRLLLVMFCFCISALPEFDRSIAVWAGKVSRAYIHCTGNTSTKYCSVLCCSLSHAAHVSNQNEMRASRASCAQTKSYDGGDLLRGCCKSLWASTRWIRTRPAGWLVGILLVVVPFTASTRSCWGCS